MFFSVFLSVLAGLLSSIPFPSTPMPIEDPVEPIEIQQEPQEQIIEPLSVSREHYEAALNVPAAEYLGPAPSTTVQGLEVHVEAFDAFFPYIVIGLSLPQIPGFERLSGANEFNRWTYLTVKNVLNRAGTAVYDAESSFEKAPFNGVDLRPIDGLEGYLEGQRQVHLQNGVKEEDLRSMEGDVVLELPVNIRAVEFMSSEQGAEKKTNGATISLSSANGTEYTFEYLGRGKHFVKLMGYDAENKQVEILSHTAEIEDALTEPTTITAAFEAPVAKIKLFVAEEIFTKNFPFTLRLEK